MKYFGYKVDTMEKRCADALKMVGLDSKYLDMNPFKLSRGEMRKVSIASVLAFNPKVIIFDEPTVGLDSISKKNFIKLIQMLKNKYGKTILLVTHDTELVYKCSDYTYILNDGSKIIVENIADVKSYTQDDSKMDTVWVKGHKARYTENEQLQRISFNDEACSCKIYTQNSSISKAEFIKLINENLKMMEHKLLD